MNLFVYLRYGLGVVLGFVGFKMLLVDIYKIPIGLSLAVVAGTLILSIVASLLLKPKMPGSVGVRFSFRTLLAGSNTFWLWFAIICAVIVAVVFVQPGFPSIGSK